MFIDITRNLIDLTDTEKKVISEADYFAHANGVLMIHTNVGNDIYWNCTNAADAYQYIKSLNVREL